MNKTILLCVVGLFCIGAASGANIVTNSGFETGFTSWTTHTCVGTCGAQGVFIANNAHTGTNAAASACIAADCLDPVSGDWLSQALTTTAATTYTFSFWMSPGNDPSDPGVEADVYWGGVKVGGFVSEPAGYHQYVIGGLVAGGTSTALEITLRHVPATVFVDDICVSTSTDCGSASAVPEPTTAFLMSSGLAGIGLFALRRRRA